MNSPSTHDDNDWILSSSSWWIQWRLRAMWGSCVCGRETTLKRVYLFHSESGEKKKKSSVKGWWQIAPRKTSGIECKKKKVPLMELEEQFKSTLHTMTPPLPLWASLTVHFKASEPLILRTEVLRSGQGQTHEATQPGEVWLAHRCVTFAEQFRLIWRSSARRQRPHTSHTLCMKYEGEETGLHLHFHSLSISLVSL